MKNTLIWQDTYFNTLEEDGLDRANAIEQLKEELAPRGGGLDKEGYHSNCACQRYEVDPLDKNMGFSEEQIEARLEDLKKDWRERELDLLDIELQNNIVAFAKVGGWQGNKYGYKVLGSNLKEILQYFVRGDSSLKVEVQDDDIISTEAHHDGRNTYTFRVLKDGLDSEELDNKPITAYRIKKFTDSLAPKISKLYGIN